MLRVRFRSISRRAFALFLAAAACRGGVHPWYPNAPVILISIDTLRSDRLPAYGYRRGSTPAIDALAADAIVYEHAYSHYPLTLPSHTSILTGLLPPHHGVRDNVGYTLDGAKHPTLARLFKQAGYDTGGFVSAFVLRHETGIADGFDVYDDQLSPGDGQSLDLAQRPGPETTRHAIDWLRARAERPFFLFLHLYEPHTPRSAPEPFRSRLADPYDAEVATADSCVGTLLAALKDRGIYERALVVLLSDHGEGLGDHGEQTHGVFLYREVLQVPLLLKLPAGREAGSRTAQPARLVDVLPTLLELAHIEAPTGDGRSLLAGAGSALARPVYSETFYPRLHYGWSELTSLIVSDHHYIDGPNPELYALDTDPAERRSIAGADRAALAGLRRELAGYDRTLQEPEPASGEAAARLAALGYLTGGVTSNGPLPDPKSQLGVVHRMEEAFTALDAGDLVSAAKGFREVLEINPRMTDIWSSLGLALQRQGRHEEAVAAFERALALSSTPAFAPPLAWSLVAIGRVEEARKLATAALPTAPREAYELLVEIAVASGDLEAAESLIAQAVSTGILAEGLHRRHALGLVSAGRAAEAVEELQPYATTGAAETRTALAAALARAGRAKDAQAMLQELLVGYPDHAPAHAMLGMIELQLGDPKAAELSLRRAVELDSRVPGAATSLGMALIQLGKPEEALEAWRQAFTADSRQYEALYNFGIVSLRMGHGAASRQALQRFIAEAPPERYRSEIAQARRLL
jgi:choline-sulfatase